MDEEKLLDIEYPPVSEEMVELELRIKRQLRSMAYNRIAEQEVSRYSFSDVQTESAAQASLIKSINIELLSPELIRMYGADISKDLDAIQVEAAEGAIGNDASEDRETDKSLEGSGDYSEYYNQEDEYVDENEKNNEGTF